MSKLSDLQEIVSLRADDPGAFLDAAFDELFGQDCLLRESALEGAHVELANFLQSADWQDAAYELNHFLGTANDDSPLDARVAALRVAISGAPEQQMQRDVRSAIGSLQNYWADGVSTRQAADGSPPSPRVTTGNDNGQRPAWFVSLKKRYQGLLENTIAPHEWSDMAVHLTGASVASMLGRWQPQKEPTVETWILFAKKKGEKITGGLVAKLSLWKIQRGNGFFYPDPLSCGYVRMQPSFREALDNAWQAIMGELPAKRDYDVCWSVQCLHPQRPDTWPPLVGRSGEAAIACALKALRDDEPLDENVAVTAMLEEATESTNLLPVTGALEKMLAEPFLPQITRKRKRIFKLVVHTDQPEGNQSFDNNTLKTVGVDAFHDAYGHASCYAIARRSLRQRIDELATGVLQSECDGEVEDGFVHPRLSRRNEQRRATPPLLGGQPDDLYEPLPEAIRDQLTSGRLWNDLSAPRRIRILANSGAGKSMLLAYCAQQMARSQDGLVPLWRGNLSDFAWQTTDPYAVIASELPWNDKLEDDERKIIVQRLCEQENLVLLLDALDQTTITTGMGNWLDESKGKLAKCPVLLTGRESTERAFSDRWEIYRLDKFGRDEQKAFLGAQYWPKLLSLRAEDAEAHGRDNYKTRDRKAHWQPLLEVPMLLKLMKKLAVDDELDGLTNRERVYNRAVEKLVERGLHTLEETEKERLTFNKAEVFLARLAWQCIGQDHDFTGLVRGESYERAIAELGPTTAEQNDLEESLDQINLFTRFSFLGARREDGIEWRHRSFMEYFAAIHLCDHLTPDQQTHSIAAVHDTLDLIERLKQQGRKHGEAGSETLIRPSDQWEWVFRFAMSRAHALGKHDTVEHLARALIAHGNPYVVYDAIRKEGGDEVVLDPPLADLCRWLVHQTWHWNRGDYAEAWTERDARKADQPDVTLTTLEIVESLFDLHWRRSECLRPAWALVETGLNSADEQVRTQAKAIHDPFLAEINELHELPVLRQFLADFQNCPRNPADPLDFAMGASPGDEEAVDGEKPRHRVRIKDRFAMADFPTTNEVYELFDPAHFWLRDQFSSQDDQPAVWVNWFMAELFCQWLSGGSGEYRLPTEAEWEFAARGGTETIYWWSDRFDSSRCNIWESGHRRTLGRDESVKANDAYRNPFGLYHIVGNVEQWCADSYDGDWYGKRTGGIEADELATKVFEDEGGPSGAASGRVLRGGDFYVGSVVCRCSFRRDSPPPGRVYYVGFRVVAWRRLPSRPSEL